MHRARAGERRFLLDAQKARKRLEMMGAKFPENMVIDGVRVRGFIGVKMAEVTLDEG